MRSVCPSIPDPETHSKPNISFQSLPMQKVSRTISKIYSKIRSPKRRSLPPEVWLAVFEVGDLGVDDMSNVRLTCSSFAALGKIQAFSSFKISPFLLTAHSINYRASFDIDHTVRRLKRLEFWTSDDIAPLVRHCRIEPQTYTHELESIIDTRKDAKALIDTVFQALPRFLNMNRLECRHCAISDQVLSQLCQLKKLRTLEVRDCTVTAKAAPQPRLEITNIYFNSYCSACGSVDERGDLGWLDLLNPEPIRRIFISFSKPEVIHLRGIATRRSLYDLSAPESDAVSRHIISILSHPSALEELTISPYVQGSCEVDLEPPGDYVLGALSLPSLRDYNGPHQILSWVATGPNLRKAKLGALDNTPYIVSSALLKTIQRETIGNFIQSLTIRVDDIPDVLLMAINSRFTHIKFLKIYANRADEDKVRIFILSKINLCSNQFWTSSLCLLCRTFRPASKLWTSICGP